MGRLDRNGYAPSIMCAEEKCYLSGRTANLCRHEVYFGKNRETSKRNGFWCFLAPELHNTSNEGAHFNRALDLKLKSECQAIYEQTHAREEFIALVGRNYLGDS